MERTRAKVLRALAGAALAGVIACTGPAGPAGADGTNGTNGVNGVNGTNGVNGINGVNGTNAPVIPPQQTRLWAKISSVTIPNAATTGGKPSITYRLFLDAAMTRPMPDCKGNGAYGYAAFTPNFTVAFLVDDVQNPGTQRWQSYLNRTLGSSVVATQEGGRGSTPGTLTDNGDGSCTYQFAADLSATADAGTGATVTWPYQPGAVTRFGLQNNPATVGPSTPVFDATLDVLPSTGVVQSANPRGLVSNAACSACHHQLAHHGAKRLSVEYCVTCHNAGTPDPDPTSVGSTTLDFAVMIHKLHQGGDLPSVSGVSLDGTRIPDAGITVVKINGTDYSGVAFPQSTGNCSVCHDQGGSTYADAWKTQASIETCGACHDRTSFAATAPAGYTLHANGAVGAQTDGSCVLCHSATSSAVVANIATVHTVAVPTLAAQKATLTILGITGTAPGQSPVVHFSVTDPASGNANEDLATDARWTTSGARLALDLAWSVNPGEDWTNTGSGAVTGFGSIVPGGSPAPGQPVSVDLLAGLRAGTPTVVKGGDGTYTFTSSVVIPANATGSGMAVLEGHPQTAAGAAPVRTATFPFAITDTAPVARRAVADIAKCDRCHGTLSLHGGNRTDNLQACAACHNPEATDVTQRPQPYGTLGLDGKPEQSIQLGAMVHAIHAGASAFSPGIVVYAFTGKAPGVGPAVPTDFRGLLFPEGNSVGKCEICHVDANPLPSADTGLVRGLTQVTSLSADQGTYLRTSKTAAICSSCHGTVLAAQHMTQNGAGWGLTQASLDQAQAPPFGPGAETCSLCHGAGQPFDPAKFHDQ